jgi:hypothetical protein
VLKLGKVSSGDVMTSGDVTACALGKSAKQASISGRRRKPPRQGERLIEFLKCRVVIFFLSL